MEFNGINISIGDLAFEFRGMNISAQAPTLPEPPEPPEPFTFQNMNLKKLLLFKI